MNDNAGSESSGCCSGTQFVIGGDIIAKPYCIDALDCNKGRLLGTGKNQSSAAPTSGRSMSNPAPFKPLFSMRFDAARCVLFIERWGYWDRYQAEAYKAAISAAAAAARPQCRPFDIVVNNARAQTMAGDASETMATLVEDADRNSVRRVAFVGSSPLVSMQVKRVTQRSDRFRLFATPEEALAWLRGAGAL